MCFIYKLFNSKRAYLIFLVFILILNVFFINKLYASSFQISDIEITEDFNLDFHKEKVFEKAFKAAFIELISSVTTSGDKEKLKRTKISTIKSLIDSFNVNNEEFIEEKYIAKFNVNFNKKNTLNFFEKKNIFPSIPNKINVLLIPILINTNNENLMIFDENPIYKNWNKDNKNYHLIKYILPNEDIEDRSILIKNLDSIEGYSFNEIINKYEMFNYIINIIYQENETLKIFSKLKFNDEVKIINKIVKNVNLNNQKSLTELINNLKNTYEDDWKNLNVINTSIRMSLRVSLRSSENKKIKLFEDTLKSLDLVSDYRVILFDNKKIVYKIIYNGSPNKFLSTIKRNNLNIEKDELNWIIK